MGVEGVGDSLRHATLIADPGLLGGGVRGGVGWGGGGGREDNKGRGATIRDRGRAGLGELPGPSIRAL
jgi:hypothetical protein